MSALAIITPAALTFAAALLGLAALLGVSWILYIVVVAPARRVKAEQDAPPPQVGYALDLFLSDQNRQRKVSIGLLDSDIKLRLSGIREDQLILRFEKERGLELRFKFGSMIEVVRACLQGSELAEVADFFSFGTNDLTQATFSFSREDAENKFLPFYITNGLLKNNPFEVLDRKAMGKLMWLAVEDGRRKNPKLKVGICGEHGGHPESIAFCHEIGLNYVSCSGPRVPVARMAAAHARLQEAK